MQKKFEDIYIIRPEVPYNLRNGDRILVYNETDGKSQYATFLELKKADKGVNTIEIVTDSGSFVQHDTQVVYQAWQLIGIVRGFGLLIMAIGAAILLYTKIIY